MPAKPRDRHGRGVRRPLPSKFFRPGEIRVGKFMQAVEDTKGYLQRNWPIELGDLEIVVLNSPRKIGDEVDRWTFNAEKTTVYLYRIPIEMFDQRRTKFDIELLVELLIFEAVAAMLGVDKSDFLEPPGDDPDDGQERFFD
ncbi:MAG: hypothetical protein ACKOWE_02845 [Micrococcales bacterium]